MQSSQPLVSVVIPCYNHEEFVQDSIQSVIDQTYKNIELIIIDDGSKDNSVIKIQEMIKSCEERFTRFEFRARKNVGLSATLNEALEWCKGTYFSAIASDDILLPHKTFRQMDFLESHEQITAVFGGAKIIDSKNNVLGEIKGTNKTYDFEAVILHKAVILAPTQMMRLKLVKDVGGFNPNLIIEDWYMWLKLTELGNIYCMQDFFCLYRRHNENTSMQLNKMHEGRLHILTFFESSKFYKKAIQEVMWLKHNELFSIEKKNRLYHLLQLFKIRPIKTTYLSFKKIHKTVFS